MSIHFRQVTESDRDKFQMWYERINGAELFSHFVPSGFVSFEGSQDLLWFIVLDNDDELGTIWFEKNDTDKMSYDLGIYLNRIELFGKGIGKTVIKAAIDGVIRKKGIREIYLNARQNNTRAIRCYEGLGFETISEGEKKTDSGKIKFKRMKLLLHCFDNAKETTPAEALSEIY
jgi:RimJ/RimL family protein N-acetyltransferase